jgi:hypothetical protein
MTDAPSGRADLLKSPCDLLAALQSTRSHAGASASPARDEEIRAANRMAPRDNAGLIGKAQAPHIKRRGYLQTIKLWNCVPACGRKATSGLDAFGSFQTFWRFRMANRAMNAKLMRARAQACEAAEIEFTKPCYIIRRHKQARYSWSV